MPAPRPSSPTRVLVLDRFSAEYQRHLKAEFPALEIHTAATIPDITVPLDTIDVLVAFGVAIDDSVMQGARNLKWIQSLATGVDHFLKSPGLRPQTLLTSARGIHGAPMRETVLLLMLGVTRNVRRLIDNQAARVWQRGDPWPLLDGKTALVAGSGVSGSAIGTMLQALGLKTIAATNAPRAIEGFDAVVHMKDIATAVRDVDFLIDVLPGGERYANVISRAVIDAMKPSAVFVNVGRGETVDEPALIDALREGRIAGAGLDVVARTPLDEASPLWAMKNVFLSPHIGGYFREYEEHMMPMLIDNMRLFLAGKDDQMQNVVPH